MSQAFVRFSNGARFRVRNPDQSSRVWLDEVTYNPQMNMHHVRCRSADVSVSRLMWCQRNNAYPLSKRIMLLVGFPTGCCRYPDDKSRRTSHGCTFARTDMHLMQLAICVGHCTLRQRSTSGRRLALASNLEESCSTFIMTTQFDTLSSRRHGCKKSA